MKCLVTGATGFVGRQLCRRLLERGDQLVALSRCGAPLPDGTPTHAIDLASARPDAALWRGVDTVFHLAGIAHQQAADEDYQQINYRATVELAQQASAAGVRCFIFVSSVKAMGTPRSGAPRTEHDVALPTDAYGRSKWEAECALRAAFSTSGMSVAIVRPALVYGAGVKGNLQRLARGVGLGLPRPPEGGRRSLLSVEDLVDLLCIIADQPPEGVPTWIACGDEDYSTRSIYDLLRAHREMGQGASWLPRWAWRGATTLMDLATPGHGGSSYDKLFAAELYDNSAVRKATGWSPRTSLDAVIGALDSDEGASS